MKVREVDTSHSCGNLLDLPFSYATIIKPDWLSYTFLGWLIIPDGCSLLYIDPLFFILFYPEVVLMWTVSSTWGESCEIWGWDSWPETHHQTILPQTAINMMNIYYIRLFRYDFYLIVLHISVQSCALRSSELRTPSSVGHLLLTKNRKNCLKKVF